MHMEEVERLKIIMVSNLAGLTAFIFALAENVSSRLSFPISLRSWVRTRFWMADTRLATA